METQDRIQETKPDRLDMHFQRQAETQSLFAEIMGEMRRIEIAINNIPDHESPALVLRLVEVLGQEKRIPLPNAELDRLHRRLCHKVVQWAREGHGATWEQIGAAQGADRSNAFSSFSAGY